MKTETDNSVITYIETKELSRWTMSFIPARFPDNTPKLPINLKDKKSNKQFHELLNKNRGYEIHLEYDTSPKY